MSFRVDYTFRIIGVTQKFAVRFALASSETVFELEKFYDPPFPSPVNDFAILQDDAVYIVNTYETPDEDTIGTLLNSYVISPKNVLVNTYDDINLKVIDGSSPPPTGYDDAVEPNQDEYNNTALAGLKFTISKRGLGKLVNLVDYEEIETGGFRLLPTGQLFEEGDDYFIHLTPQSDIQSFGSSNTLIKGVVVNSTNDLTVNTGNMSGYINKLISFEGSATVMKFKFNDLNEIADNTPFTLNTNYFTHNHVEVSILANGAFKFKGTNSKTVLWMGRNENWLLIKSGSFMYAWPEGDVNRVGEVVNSLIQPSNGIALTSGAWVSKLDRPRIYDFVNSANPADIQTITHPIVPPVATRFAIDSVNEWVWIPGWSGHVDKVSTTVYGASTRSDFSPIIQSSPSIAFVGSYKWLIV